MNFINPEKIAIAAKLNQAHFEFPRADTLKQAFQRCVEERYMCQEINGMEARGLVVTGASRVGKTRELKKLISDFNESKTPMPDGRPAKIVSCLLAGRVTFKDLALRTLTALQYDPQRSRTQEYLWERVLDQAKGQGVIGIHYDECQHVFIEGAKSNPIFLDSFKSMMKEPRWPLMMILSGVPSLSKHVRSYEQLDKLVDPVHFSEIKLKRDEDLLVALLYGYADQVEIDIEGLVTRDFLARLDHACANRWGLVIELLIGTLIAAKLERKSCLTKDDFVEQFALRSGVPASYSPFVVADFEKAYDPRVLFELCE